MTNKLNEEPPLSWIHPEKAMAIWIVSCLLIIIASLLFICFARVPEEEQEVELERCFLKAQSSHYAIRGEAHAMLIDCLVYYESKGYKWAKGEAGELGILQFKPATFQHYCVDIYGYRDDIWDEEIQRDCCGEMIEDGRLNHWTTRKFCYKLVK